MTQHQIVLLTLIVLSNTVSASVFPTFSSKKVRTYGNTVERVQSAKTTINNPTQQSEQKTIFTSMPRVQSVAHGSIFLTESKLVPQLSTYTFRGSIPPPSDDKPNPKDQLPLGNSLTLAFFAIIYSLSRFITREITCDSKPREAAKR